MNIIAARVTFHEQPSEPPKVMSFPDFSPQWCERCRHRHVWWSWIGQQHVAHFASLHRDGWSRELNFTIERTLHTPDHAATA